MKAVEQRLSTGAPNEKISAKYLKRRFLRSQIVLELFKGIFV